MSDLGTWAKKRQKRVQDRARQRLMLLEPGDSPGIVRHSFKLTDRDAYKRTIRGKGIFDRAEKVEPTEVAVEDVQAIQPYVNVERLAQYVESGGVTPKGKRAPGHGGLVDYPVLVKIGGQLYVHDGHHRLAASKLLGCQTIRARVIDL